MFRALSLSICVLTVTAGRADEWRISDGRSPLILPSDHCFDNFISPISNPFFFEDPRSLTELRGVFIENSLPNNISGGDAQVWATQIRLRISDRWSLIAPRLAYLNVHEPSGEPLKGFLSSPVGVKCNFVRDVSRQFFVSGGATYFIPGSEEAFSDFGDGDVHVFLTAGDAIGCYGHWLSATGFRLPVDTNWGTQLWYWSNQWDVEVAPGWHPLVGINWFHWLRNAGVAEGGGDDSSVAGLDIVNVPAGGVAGTDVVTGVVGLRWKPTRRLETGFGFELPLTDREDILHHRLYVDAAIRF